MEILKARQPSDLLRGLNYLDKRFELKEPEKRYLINLQKGLSGETAFDDKINQHIDKQAIVLNDLLLLNKGLSFKVDSLLIASHGVYIFEIRNYVGRYVRHMEGFSTIHGEEVANPLIQLNRSASFLSQLLKEWGSELKVTAHLVFIHPQFSLYNARVEDPIILPNQIDEYLKDINIKSRMLSREHHNLARRIIKLHDDDSPVQKQLPYYSYKELKKGLSCNACGSFDLLITQRSCYCKSCFVKRGVTDVILDNIEELQFLFPETTLTTAKVNEWCGDAVHFRRMRKVLKEHYTATGATSGRVYEQTVPRR